ncbi:MAG: hypothetical protein DWQ49_12435 [Bacteroidetes bacterium]|nr:MAG: hypothetical protein DWQ49_12435 [Bacteroidota bacterium]
MSNKKEVLHVKSNGLRNELKEIRKSIDKLTDAIRLAQTHKRYEKDISTHRSTTDASDDWGMYDYE